MSSATPINFHPLRVHAVRPETDEARVLSFEVPEALRAAYAYTQGRYLTLRATIDGQDLRRSYSICAGLDDGELRVGVRRVAGGVFSNWIHSQVQAGDTLQVMVPQGRFYAPLQPDAAQHHLGIAGGSGITPILSILKTVLAREPRSRFTLLYGNRQLRSTMFKGELDDLKDRYLTRLAVHHVFSDEHSEAPMHRGLMDRNKVGAFLRTLVPAAGVSQAYICGPYQMNDEAEAALLAAGVPAERIHVERFGIAPSESSAAPALAPTVRQGLDTQVVIVRDGLRREITVRPEHGNILAAAAAAGLEVPYSCTSGVCGTCRAQVLEGQVQMARNFALDRREVAAGQVLCCQAQPLTPRVLLSFDER